MNLLLLCSSLLTIYKSFDYGDVIYDQPNNSHLSDKIESVQYNTALAITGAIRGTSEEKLYQEVGLESLKGRTWLRPMSYLYKIISRNLPPYLFEFLPYKGHIDTLVIFKLSIVGLYFSKFVFITCHITEWNKLDSNIKNIDSHVMFLKKLLAFIRPLGNDTCGIYDPLGIRLLNRLRLGFSHLREHRFKHNFADTLNPLCSCSLENDNTEHYFLHY